MNIKELRDRCPNEYMSSILDMLDDLARRLQAHEQSHRTGETKPSKKPAMTIEDMKRLIDCLIVGLEVGTIQPDQLAQYVMGFMNSTTNSVPISNKSDKPNV